VQYRKTISSTSAPAIPGERPRDRECLSEPARASERGERGLREEALGDASRGRRQGETSGNKHPLCRLHQSKQGKEAEQQDWALKESNKTGFESSICASQGFNLASSIINFCLITNHNSRGGDEEKGGGGGGGGGERERGKKERGNDTLVEMIHLLWEEDTGSRDTYLAVGGADM
jgi:hypothetical protein